MPTSRVPRRLTWRRRLALVAFGLGLSLVLAEVVCQFVTFMQYRTWGKDLGSPRHFYRKSTNDILGYELLPGFDYEVEGRRLHINSRGIRDDAEDLGEFASRRIALLGDSALFGIGLVDVPESRTIPGFMRQRLDPSGTATRVFNCSVPGYSLREFPEYMRTVVAPFKPHTVVFILNLNDFCIRDTVTEGSDNGLYRMYHHPGITTPWVIRKAIYRLHKNGLNPTLAWYRWVFDSSKAQSLEHLAEMRDIAKSWNADFAVVILPSGNCYNDGVYTAASIHTEIAAFLDSRHIPCLNPIDDMKRDPGPAALYDITDHLTEPGLERMAGLIIEHCLGEASNAPPAPPSDSRSAPAPLDSAKPR